MDSLYPLKFKPIYKDYIWGGTKLRDKFNKKIPSNVTHCAESWEISSIDENISVVSNGFLEGNNLQELIEIYMGDLVGDKVYDKFGDEFPLLIKLMKKLIFWLITRVCTQLRSYVIFRSLNGRT